MTDRQRQLIVAHESNETALRLVSKLKEHCMTDLIYLNAFIQCVRMSCALAIGDV